MTSDQPPTRPKLTATLPLILIVGGLVGLLCSLILTHDQIQVWLNPGYQPACSLNPIISCGTVINSNQGHVFGFPAPFLGLLAFPPLIAVGVILKAGAKLKRWFWLVLEAGALGGSAFALWLFFISLYQIHSLCPLCLITDVAVYTITWYLTLFNLEHGFIKFPTGLSNISRFIQRQHLLLLLSWLLMVALFTTHHFWYYFGRHL